MNKSEIIESLPVNACQEGLNVLKKTRSNKKLIELFWDYVDYCLAMDFPSLEYLKQNSVKINTQNIFVDEDRSFENIKRGAFLGTSKSDLRFNGFAVSRIYVKHDSEITIKSSGNAFIVVDAHDTSRIDVEASDNSKVIVYLYADAKCSGATKIVQKNIKTYELDILETKK